MTPAPASPLLVVGIDVGSRWLDCSWPDGRAERVVNSSIGWRKLVADSAGHVLVMEATGVYYLGVARAAHEAGRAVRVVNPWQVRAFAQSRLTRTKTDGVDAALIRDFGVRMMDDLPMWWPMPEGLERVSGLVRFADGLMKHRVAAGNRVHALEWLDPRLAETAASVAEMLRGERKRVLGIAAEVARADELVGVWLSALCELPGFGETSALRLLAYSGDLRRFGNARQFAAFTGLAPRFKQSGTVAGVGVMSRVGSRELRGVLYWAAVAASRSSGPHGVLYRRLRQVGRPGKVAVVAVANRLARASWSVCVKGS